MEGLRRSKAKGPTLQKVFVYVIDGRATFETLGYWRWQHVQEVQAHVRNH